MNPFTVRTNAHPRALPATLLLLLVFAGRLPAQEQADDSDKPIQMKMEYQPNACKAQLAVEYFQRGDKAHVKTELTNEDCAASAGSYTIRVRIRGADGEIKSTDHPETWKRSDESSVATEKDYFIGDDVDLINVRSRNLKCECAIESAEP